MNHLRRSLLILSAFPALSLLAREVPSDFDRFAEAAEKWEGDIQEFEDRDKTESHPADSILFAGSSSIRLWDDIREDMAPYHPIQRGYGGASYADLVFYIDRIIEAHSFQALVLFAGNDVKGKDSDKTPEEVAAFLEHILSVVREKKGDVPVFVVEVTPTIARFEIWPKTAKVNEALKRVCEKSENVHFVPTKQAYIIDGKPNGALFGDDDLHQNRKGYAVWSGIIKESLRVAKFRMLNGAMENLSREIASEVRGIQLLSASVATFQQRFMHALDQAESEQERRAREMVQGVSEACLQAKGAAELDRLFSDLVFASSKISYRGGTGSQTRSMLSSSAKIVAHWQDYLVNLESMKFIQANSALTSIGNLLPNAAIIDRSIILERIADVERRLEAQREEEVEERDARTRIEDQEREEESRQRDVAERLERIPPDIAWIAEFSQEDELGQVVEKLIGLKSHPFFVRGGDAGLSILLETLSAIRMARIEIEGGDGGAALRSLGSAKIDFGRSMHGDPSLHVPAEFRYFIKKIREKIARECVEALHGEGAGVGLRDGDLLQGYVERVAEGFKKKGDFLGLSDYLGFIDQYTVLKEVVPKNWVALEKAGIDSFVKGTRDLESGDVVSAIVTLQRVVDHQGKLVPSTEVRRVLDELRASNPEAFKKADEQSRLEAERREASSRSRIRYQGGSSRVPGQTQIKKQ